MRLQLIKVEIPLFHDEHTKFVMVYRENLVQQEFPSILWNLENTVNCARTIVNFMVSNELRRRVSAVSSINGYIRQKEDTTNGHNVTLNVKEMKWHIVGTPPFSF